MVGLKMTPVSFPILPHSLQYYNILLRYGLHHEREVDLKMKIISRLFWRIYLFCQNFQVVLYLTSPKWRLV